jgi:IS30 family transposase
MTKPLTSTEKQRIGALLDDNQSHNSIARAVGRSQSTISEYARREGYSPLPERTPRVANKARREYAKAERLELLNLVFEKGEEMLKSPDLTARAYKEVVTGIAIGVDKARLEEGQPNSVRETRSSSGGATQGKTINLEEEFKRLDEAMEEQARQEQERQEL